MLKKWKIMKPTSLVYSDKIKNPPPFRSWNPHTWPKKWHRVQNIIDFLSLRKSDIFSIIFYAEIFSSEVVQENILLNQFFNRCWKNLFTGNILFHHPDETSCFFITTLVIHNQHCESLRVTFSDAELILRRWRVTDEQCADRSPRMTRARRCLQQNRIDQCERGVVCKLREVRWYLCMDAFASSSTSRRGVTPEQWGGTIFASQLGQHRARSC